MQVCEAANAYVWTYVESDSRQSITSSEENQYFEVCLHRLYALIKDLQGLTFLTASLTCKRDELEAYLSGHATAMAAWHKEANRDHPDFIRTLKTNAVLLRRLAKHGEDKKDILLKYSL